MKFQHFSSVVFVFLEVFVAAAFNGWAFLTPIFKIEGHFSHLCKEPHNESDTFSTIGPTNISALMENVTKSRDGSSSGAYLTCTEQTEMLNLVFVVATFVATASFLIGGILFQKLKTRACRLLAIAGYAGGCIFIATSSANRPEFLFPGMILLGLSSSVYYITGEQFSNLFPNARASIIATLTGLYLSGSAVFWIAKFVYQAGIALSSIFYFLGSFSILSLAATFTLAPKDYIPHPLPKDFVFGLANCKATCKNKMTQHDTAPAKSMSDSSLSHEKNNDRVKFLVMIRKMFYLTVIVQIAVLHLRNEFFQGTFDTWSESLTMDNDELARFTNAYGIILLVGGVAASLTGILVDTLKRRYRTNIKHKSALYGVIFLIGGLAAPQTGSVMDALKRRNCSHINIKTEVELKALYVTSALVSTLSLLFSTAQCIPGLRVQYLTLVSYVVFRTAIYSNCAIAIATYFPAKSFGTFFGIALIIAGAVSFVRYPLLSLVLRNFGGNFTQVNIILLALCLVAFVHPYYCWRLFRHRVYHRAARPSIDNLDQKIQGETNRSFEENKSVASQNN